MAKQLRPRKRALLFGGDEQSACAWANGTRPVDELKAVIYDFAPGRSGEHAARFLEGWRGALMCDGFAGYKALFANGVIEAGCMAMQDASSMNCIPTMAVPLPARHWAGSRHCARSSVWRRISMMISEDDYANSRPDRSPSRCTDGTEIAKAIDYSLKRWAALTRYLDDGQLPIDNNHLENRIRPIALGRSNWLFAGSLRGGQRSAAAMSLIQSAKLNGLDPFQYLKDVLERLPTQPNSRIGELLPHNWAAGRAH